jgi:hypothetical protein
LFLLIEKAPRSEALHCRQRLSLDIRDPESLTQRSDLIDVPVVLAEAADQQTPLSFAADEQRDRLADSATVQVRK